MAQRDEAPRSDSRSGEAGVRSQEMRTQVRSLQNAPDVASLWCRGLWFAVAVIVVQALVV
jgi:hypothetical protein